MVSPVLFYHQDHPVKAVTTQRAPIAVWSMLMNIVVPLSPTQAHLHSPGHAA
jgi:hypothetical protein